MPAMRRAVSIRALGRKDCRDATSRRRVSASGSPDGSCRDCGVIGLDAWQATGAELSSPYFLTLLAETHAHTIVGACPTRNSVLLLSHSIHQRWGSGDVFLMLMKPFPTPPKTCYDHNPTLNATGGRAIKLPRPDIEDRR